MSATTDAIRRREKATRDAREAAQQPKKAKKVKEPQPAPSESAES